jgi:hypothetical protein
MRRYLRHRRFWALVDARGPRDCWLWRGDYGPDGVAWYRGRMAAEWSYAFARGGRVDAVSVRCGNPLCVNPEHIEPDARPGHRRPE